MMKVGIGMNEVIANIRNRRSIRNYQPEQVSEMELNQILEAGQYAPSGGNSQSNHFIVVQNQDVLSELKRLVEQEFCKMDVYDGIYRSLRNSILASKKGGYDFTYQAPTLVIVANKKGYGNAIADCACALENMMLAAATLDIGSCWVNQLHWLDDNRYINQYLMQLGLAEDETICGGLVLGYKGNSKEQTPLQRRGNLITYVR